MPAPPAHSWIEYYSSNNLTASTEPPDVWNITRDPTRDQVPYGDPRPSREFMFIIYFLRSVTSLLSLVGNSLTIAAILRFKRLHSCTNILIASLATADFLGALHTPLFILHDVYWKVAAIYVPTCLTEKWLSMISTRENIQGILLIAIDRYLFIVHPLRYHLLVTKNRVFTVIAMSWILGSLEISLLMGLTQELRIGMTCKYFVFLADWVSYYLIGVLFVNIFITAGLYLGIARVAVHQSRAIEAQAQGHDPRSILKTKNGRRVYKMMLTVLGVYLACYVPSAITSNLIQQRITVDGLMVDHIATLIFWVNIWANPVIYAWKSNEFKTAFLRLLGKKSSNDTSNTDAIHQLEDRQ